MTGASFRGHAAIVGLVAVATDALTGVTVIDGPAKGKPSEKELLLIGWDDQQQNHVIAQRVEADALGGAIEQGDIACFIATRKGNADMASTRARGAEILAELETAVRANPTLNGSVAESSVGPAMALTQYQTTQDGASIGLSFSVSYEAYV